MGSLFIVGALFKEEDLEELKKIKVKDSKLLTHKKRLELEKKIKKIAKKIKIIKIEPEEIDRAVDGQDGLNLNWLEARKTIEIINSLKPDKVFIDCPSPNIRRYTEYLKKSIENKKTELIVEHKADVKYIACSAASILAKCERENEVETLKKKYGDIGPGYSSNPITQKFIKENWEKYPELFRKSWSTYLNHKNSKFQKKLDEF